MKIQKRKKRIKKVCTESIKRKRKIIKGNRGEKMESNTELMFVKKNGAMSKATTLLKIRAKSYEKMKWKTRHIKS